MQVDDRRDAIFKADAANDVATCKVLSEQWLDEHPDDDCIRLAYAKTLSGLTAYREAIQQFDLVEACAETDDVHILKLVAVSRGLLERYRGDFKAAEKHFVIAVARDPEDAGNYIFLGAVQARMGLLEKAERTHRTAIACPFGAIDEAYLNLGFVLRAQGRLEEAATSFRHAIEIDSEYAAAISALDDVLAAQRLISPI